MTQQKFNRLKVGDSATLAVARKEYSCGHKTPDGCVYVPAGTKGIVGAVRVPSVRRDNVTFCCIDFKRHIAFEDHRGKPAKHWRRKDLPPSYRVSVLADDLLT